MLMAKKQLQTDFLLEIKEGRVLIRAYQPSLKEALAALLLVCGLALLVVALLSPDTQAQALTMLVALIKSTLSAIPGPLN